MRKIWSSPSCSVDLGEAMSLSQVLQWVAELGFDGMDFSIDSKIVVDAFNGGSIHNTKCGSTI